MMIKMLAGASGIACFLLVSAGVAQAEDPGWEGGFIGVGPDGVYEIDRYSYEITQISDVGIGDRYGTGGAAGWDFEHSGCVIAGYVKWSPEYDDCLYSIDCTTGAVTDLGRLWWDPADPHRDPDYGPLFHDIAYDITTDTMYGYSHNKGLFSIDPASMTFRKVGPWTCEPWGLESVPGRGLYAFTNDDEWLVLLDNTMGGHIIGDPGMGIREQGDIAWARRTKTLLAASRDELWRIDIDTGAGTLISSGGPHITGLAMPAHTPEPASCILLACSGLIVAIGRRRRNRTE